MQPILRFLQLLCENHNRDLQVYVVFLKYTINPALGNYSVVTGQRFWEDRVVMEAG